jgi:hypothetical protein
MNIKNFYADKLEESMLVSAQTRITESRIAFEEKLAFLRVTNIITLKIRLYLTEIDESITHYR